MILPSGQLVIATDDNEYSDLLRALRGHGGNLGIVTKKWGPLRHERGRKRMKGTAVVWGNGRASKERLLFEMRHIV